MLTMMADDAHQHQHIADQGDHALREQFVDHRHVVDHARNGDADDMRIVIAQRELLQVRINRSPRRLVSTRCPTHESRYCCAAVEAYRPLKASAV